LAVRRDFITGKEKYDMALEWNSSGTDARKKKNGTIACSVCKGLGVLRMTAAEISTWQERLGTRMDLPRDLVVRNCWACGGAGRLNVAEDYRNSRFR
jgi:hypothetical protein